MSDIIEDANSQIRSRAWNEGRDEGKAWYDIDQLSLEYLKGPDSVCTGALFFLNLRFTQYVTLEN